MALPAAQAADALNSKRPQQWKALACTSLWTAQTRRAHLLQLAQAVSYRGTKKRKGLPRQGRSKRMSIRCTGTGTQKLVCLTDCSTTPAASGFYSRRSLHVLGPQQSSHRRQATPVYLGRPPAAATRCIPQARHAPRPLQHAEAIQPMIVKRTEDSHERGLLNVPETVSAVQEELPEVLVKVHVFRREESVEEQMQAL